MYTGTPRRAAPGPDGEARVVGALIGLLAVVGLYAFLQSPFFAVGEVHVQGLVTVAADEIVALSGVRQGDNLLTIDLRASADAVAVHPRIERAAVQRRLPGGLVISVVEHEPMMLVPDGDTLIAVARDGSDVPYSPEEAARLPTVRDGRDAMLDTFLRIASAMPEDMRAGVAEMFVERNTIMLRGRAGETVLLGDGSELERKLTIAASLLRDGRYVVIDVRYPLSPAVRSAD